MSVAKRLGTLLCMTCVLLTGVPASVAPALAQSAGRPNIILILTDDLDTESMNHLPRLNSLIADQGTTFTNFFVSLSLCCPSRASILRGQYSHNTQIFTNYPPTGGFQLFHSLGEEESTVATWLQGAGYRTVLLGKYLNGYPNGVAATFIPPGWNEWYSPSGGNPYGEFGYQLNENGKIVSYGFKQDAYLTDVLSKKADDFIQRVVATGDQHPPFFMYLATYAPHRPPVAPARYRNAFPGVQAPRTPSFNEADVSDKPAWLRGLSPLTQQQIQQIDDIYGKRLRTMLAVEDLVDGLIQTLTATGELDHTYIFFTSDNGFHFGQHRLPLGKGTEFEEDLRVPLIVRGPGVPVGALVTNLTVNVDLAPTFADLAGAPVPDFVDGRSLSPLLQPGPVIGWRQAFLIEHGAPNFGPAGKGGASAPGQATPDGILEPPDPFDVVGAQSIIGNCSGFWGKLLCKIIPGWARVPAFEGIHTTRFKYVEWSTGERELYDLTADPYELQSFADTADTTLLAQLTSWLDALQKCVGAECRTAEETPPSGFVSRAWQHALVAGAVGTHSQAP